jgi:hypothetical protein
MKVTEIHEFYNSDHEDASNVIVNITNDKGEEREVSIGEGEPEDMYLFRDLSSAYSISDLIKMAYEAGKAGEEFEYEFIEEKDEE